MKLAIAILVALCSLARAQSFEAKAASAQPVHRIENVVWALTATCEAGDDIAQRQCRHVRDARQAELAGQTLLVEADAQAFDVGTWSAAKKTIPLTISACIRCLGVEVDGKTYYVVGNGVATHFQGALLQAGALRAETRAFSDEAAAKAWARAVGNAHVQLVVKIPPHVRAGDSKTLALEVVAWRVYAPCDGAIIAASPPSSPVDADKNQCIPPAVTEPGPELPDLSADVIRTVMQPVVDAAHICFGKLAVTGKAKLQLRVLRDGTIGRYDQLGDFVNTPTGACIDRAVAKLKFPATKDGMSINFPITAQP